MQLFVKLTTPILPIFLLPKEHYRTEFLKTKAHKHLYIIWLPPQFHIIYCNNTYAYKNTHARFTKWRARRYKQMNAICLYISNRIFMTGCTKYRSCTRYNTIMEWSSSAATGLMSIRIFEFPMMTFTFDQTTRLLGIWVYGCDGVF